MASTQTPMPGQRQLATRGSRVTFRYLFDILPIPIWFDLHLDSACVAFPRLFHNATPVVPIRAFRHQP
eukprot:45797-Eustigmatos_ZCMA.PRE.1